MSEKDFVDHKKLRFAICFSKSLQKEKEKQQISIRKIAKDIGKSPTYIVKILEGSELPSYEVYSGLCRLFDIKAVKPEEYPSKSHSYKDSRIKELEQQLHTAKQQLEEAKEVIKKAIDCASNKYCEDFCGMAEYNKNFLQTLNGGNNDE